MRRHDKRQVLESDSYHPLLVLEHYDRLQLANKSMENLP